ncbi:hypothetical protein B0T14DRAFT_568678 [Immersiella caudata]|uniref:Uncharacterized protein n=1 Tax=Immersiella caudata TaxID=314043 RepID=A0AA39WKL4_9PEZI|nr:hypothetical protein B0T14DRAFT_568678 [Immersiella caudata]
MLDAVLQTIPDIYELIPTSVRELRDTAAWGARTLARARDGVEAENMATMIREVGKSHPDFLSDVLASFIYKPVISEGGNCAYEHFEGGCVHRGFPRCKSRYQTVSVRRE